MAKDVRASLARKNLEKRLAPLRDIEFTPPRSGWIRAIRDALGLSTRQFAKRLNVVQSRIVALERAEVTGSTSLRSLREAAAALDCRFVYAFVPALPLDAVIRARASEKARQQFASVAQAMLLENQSLSVSQMKEEIARLTDEILAEPIRLLWEDE